MTGMVRPTVGKLLVTGSHGFVGEHVRMAVDAGRFGDAEFLGVPRNWDIRDPEAVAALIEELRPDSVLHLAGQSFVPLSFEDPQGTFAVNVMGTLNLLSALKRSGFLGRMVYVSSGDVYGRVPEPELPVDEARAPEPRNPYAASKVAAEQLCMQWHRSEGLDVIVARPFNHIGPGQDARFVVPALATQVVRIADGRQAPVVEAGDIDTTRDFTDVRDVVTAYAHMLSAGTAGSTYVVGSGIERRVRDLLQMMCQIEQVMPELRQDPAMMRPAEQRRMVANAELLNRDTGWQPLIPIETSLTDILSDARTRK